MSSVLFFLFSTSFMVCSTYVGLNEEWEPMEDEAISVAESPRSAERPRVTHRDDAEDRSQHIRKFPHVQKNKSQAISKKSKERDPAIKEEYRKKRAERIKSAKAQRPASKNEK